jgi:predicted transport protein
LATLGNIHQSPDRVDKEIDTIGLKLYSGQGNYFDKVVPQAKRLRLSLNLPFPEVRDPRGLTKDVTNLGRWGNGDVEVGLETLADLPYVMGLVEQAFEHQMGNGDAVS